MQDNSCGTTYRLFHDEDRSDAFYHHSYSCLPYILDHKKTTENRRNCIRGTPWSQLEDRDFADDLALLSQGHQQMQKKTAKHSQHSYNSSSTEARQII